MAVEGGMIGWWGGRIEGRLLGRESKLFEASAVPSNDDLCVYRQDTAVAELFSRRKCRWVNAAGGGGGGGGGGDIRKWVFI